MEGGGGIVLFYKLYSQICFVSQETKSKKNCPDFCYVYNYSIFFKKSLTIQLQMHAIDDTGALYNRTRGVFKNLLGKGGDILRFPCEAHCFPNCLRYSIVKGCNYTIFLLIGEYLGHKEMGCSYKVICVL